MKRQECELSVVVPMYNEGAGLRTLHREIRDVLEGLPGCSELIFVDDGSSDDTRSILRELRAVDRSLTVVRLRRNSGQTAALDAGLRLARGRIVVTMDADLQNDPADIPTLLKALEDEDLDAVAGWRSERRDPWCKRTASKGANALRRLLTREPIHDSGCTLRAYRLECLDGLDLYGEMHRFVPAILALRGFRVGEAVVRHRPRRHGGSKYGPGRLVRGLLDLLVVFFWLQYRTRPIHLFGGVGLLMLALGGGIGAYLSAVKLLHGVALAGRPLLLLVIVLVIVGLQLVILGLMADVLLKIYNRGVPAYSIAEVHGPAAPAVDEADRAT